MNSKEFKSKAYLLYIAIACLLIAVAVVVNYLFVKVPIALDLGLASIMAFLVFKFAVYNFPSHDQLDGTPSKE